MHEVLVIDDELNMRKIIETNLRASGYNVVTAATGEEGLAAAARKKPDLIFLDIKMPRMPGWDVLSALRADRRLAEVPVIIMTAFTRKEEETRAADMGVRGFLSKPFDVKNLLDTAEKALENNP